MRYINLLTYLIHDVLFLLVVSAGIMLLLILTSYKSITVPPRLIVTIED